MRLRRILALLLALLVMTLSCQAVQQPAPGTGNTFTAQRDEKFPASLHPPKRCAAMLTEKGIGVSWSPVSGARKYLLWRKTPGEEYTLVKTTSQTSLVDQSVEKGQRYCYRVSAFASSGNKEFASRKSKAAIMDYYPLFGHIICVDAGHGNKHNLPQVPLAPGSKKMVSGGTVGTASPSNRVTEAAITLKVAKRLKNALEGKGAEVVMTRTQSECTLNNVQRCQVAEKAGAELTVRIHANGSDDPSIHGIEVLVQDKKYCSKDLVKKSRRAGKKVCKAMVKATGAEDRGIISRSDLTGFNWANTPSILVEMGYMSNPKEDKKLQKRSYQKKMVKGMTDGVIDYFFS